MKVLIFIGDGRAEFLPIPWSIKIHHGISALKTAHPTDQAAAFIENWLDIHRNRHAGAVQPLENELRIMDSLAGSKDLGQRPLLRGENRAILAMEMKSLVVMGLVGGVTQRFHQARIVLANHAVQVAAEYAERQKIEQPCGGENALRQGRCRELYLLLHTDLQRQEQTMLHRFVEGYIPLSLADIGRNIPPIRPRPAGLKRGKTLFVPRSGISLKTYFRFG